MITKNDLAIQNDSYTKKDFYEIYPELLDMFKILTDKYDPETSNESDPIIVLLKLLAANADILNYNLDKQELENKLPSATQEESVRKITEMLGYDMKYTQSAVTPVTFMWQGSNLPKADADDANTKRVVLSAFDTSITDDSGTINYVLTNDVILTTQYEEQTANAIEGELVQLTVNSDNVLRIENIDDNYRYYMPESGIAENGIWLINNDSTSLRWTKRNNLNVRYYDEYTRQAIHTVWKFGYDSVKNLPYIQFNSDINEYIGEGLIVYYIRSSGASGNITAKTLTKLVNTELTIQTYDSSSGSWTDGDSTVSSDDYLVIQNSYATNTGKDKETIDQAYNSYKKTIGTFDTLVTCMDYANYIYQMQEDDLIDNSYLVSNCQVSDIRTDINNSMVVASHNESSITYNNVARKTTQTMQADIATTQTDSNMSSSTKTKVNSLKTALQNDDAQITVNVKADSMDNFDLYIYPLNAINTSYTKDTYQKSFKPVLSTDADIIADIQTNLEDTKTIAHKIKQFKDTDTNVANEIYLIKNYYKLAAKINTNYKVTLYEILDIKNNVYNALYQNFNSRELDYGEEIPYDTLLSVIQNADSRIKSVSLDEPELETKYMTPTGTEGILSNSSSSATAEDKAVYRRLVIKNVLAGRAPLFNYNSYISCNFNQLTNSSDSNIYGNTSTYVDSGFTINPSTGAPSNDTEKAKLKNLVLESTTSEAKSITAVSTNLTIPTGIINDSSNHYTLRENENVLIGKSKLSDVVTYPAYVSYNYYRPGADTSLTINNTSICNLKELDNCAITDYNKQYSKSITTLNELVLALTSLGFNIYKRSTSGNFAKNPGKLVDNDRYEYTLCGQRSGGLYKTDWTYNSQLTYYIPTSIRRYSFLSGNQSIFELYEYTKKITSGVVTSLTVTNITPESGEKTFDSNNKFVFASNYVTKNDVQIDWNTDVSAPGVYCVNYTEQETSGEVTTIKTYEIHRYTVGLDTSYDPIIKADTAAELGNDILYISLTDSDEVDHSYKYYKNSSGKYVREDNGVVDTDFDFSGIIKPNFDIYASNQYAVMGSGHSYSKTADSSKGTYYLKNDSTSIQGMFALGTNEQIAIESYSKAYMKEQCYLYWTTNNNNKLTFKYKEKDTATSLYLYEVILEDGEYLFYTNSAKTNLVTLGSGNKLTLYTDTQTSSGEIVWDLQTSQNITVDDIAKNGIGAFANSNWILKNFNKTTLYLETEQLELTTLDKGIQLEQITLEETNTYIDSSKWYDLSSLKYKEKDNTSEITISKTSGSNLCLVVKTALNLNVGPALEQNVQDYTETVTNTDGTNVTYTVKQDIKFYTSYWCTKDTDGNYQLISNSDIQDYIKYDSDNIIEYVIPYSVNKDVRQGETADNGSIHNSAFRSSYTIQKLGGEGLSTRSYTITGTVSDNMGIYPYTSTKATMKDQNNKEYDFEVDTNINIATYPTITLHTYVPNANKGIFSIYLKGSENLTVKITSNTANSICFFKNFIGDETTYTNTLTLVDGLNTILVDKSSTLTIQNDIGSATSYPQGIIRILSYKLIKEDNNGINVDYLGLQSSEAMTFLNELNQELEDIDTQFYYDIDIPNSLYIDVSTLDNPYSWFNVNNVCSLFTLAELDVSTFSNIEISRSSKKD